MKCIAVKCPARGWLLVLLCLGLYCSGAFAQETIVVFFHDDVTNDENKAWGRTTIIKELDSLTYRDPSRGTQLFNTIVDVSEWVETDSITGVLNLTVMMLGEEPHQINENFDFDSLANYLDTTLLQPDKVLTVDINRHGSDLEYQLRLYQNYDTTFVWDSFRKILTVNKINQGAIFTTVEGSEYAIKVGLHKLFIEANKPAEVTFQYDTLRFYDCDTDSCGILIRSIDQLELGTIVTDIDSYQKQLAYTWYMQGDTLPESVPDIVQTMPLTDSTLVFSLQVSDTGGIAPTDFYKFYVKVVPVPAPPPQFHSYTLVDIVPYRRTSFAWEQGGMVWGKMPFEVGGAYPLDLEIRTREGAVPVMFIPYQQLPGNPHAEDLTKARTRLEYHDKALDSLWQIAQMPDAAMMVYYGYEPVSDEDNRLYPVWYYIPHRLPMRNDYQVQITPSAEGLPFPKQYHPLSLVRTNYHARFGFTYWNGVVPQRVVNPAAGIDSSYSNLAYSLELLGSPVYGGRGGQMYFGGGVTWLIEPPYVADTLHLSGFLPSACIKFDYSYPKWERFYRNTVGMGVWYQRVMARDEVIHRFPVEVTLEAAFLLLNIAEVGVTFGAFAGPPTYSGDYFQGHRLTLNLTAFIPTLK